MDCAHKESLVLTRSARRLIRAKARQLCLRRDFQRCEQADIEQELWLAVLENSGRFDPQRASLETFLDRIVCSAAAMLLRRRWRQKRNHGLPTLSLESDCASTSEGPEPLAAAISPEDLTRRLGTVPADPLA